jgi:sec-independent protein translocase protein TatA
MGLSTTHLLIVLVVMLLLFGSKLPDVMRNLGRSAAEFKKGMNDVGGELMRDDKSDLKD